MRKTRFAIIGSGWRALYYVRIAKALKDHFELCGLLCRKQEKQIAHAKQFDIHTTCSIDEIRSLAVDFVVVAVDKMHISETTIKWLDLGFPVLCETPSGMDIDQLEKLYECHLEGKKITVAEQYHLFPENIARSKLIDMNFIGTPHYLNISLAHEYHGISLMRRFLKTDIDTPFTIMARSFAFPTRETLTRYERFTDGRIADKTRTLALFSFADGKVALYDFDSEQYRSSIRNSHYKLQGVDGEIINDTVTYLDKDSNSICQSLVFTSRIVKTDSDNPNFSEFAEMEKISFSSSILYEAPFGLCGLSQDETAIALMLKKMSDYVAGGKEPYPLIEALQDAYMAILLRRAIESGEEVGSEKMPWMR